MSAQDTTIGAFAPFRYGKALPERDRVEGGVPVYSSAGKTGSHTRAIVNGPGIIIGRKGTVGSIHLSTEPFWPIDTAYYIEDEPHRDLRYTYYLLQSQKLARLNADSAVPGLNRDAAHAVPICVPSLDTQQQIGHILGTLDDKIALNNAMNETLEATALALFHDWFVDFGPVRAKMEGREPYLARDVWALFPDWLDEEKKPEGWGWSDIKNDFNLTMGQSPPGDTYNSDENGVPFFQGSTDFGNRYPQRRKFCTAPTRMARTDDTLVSVRAPVGDINMAWEECCIGRGVAAVRHKLGYRSFTFYALHNLRGHFSQFEHTGTVFGAINKSQFERLPVISPPANMMEAFDAATSPLDERIRSNNGESYSLSRLRDALLPRLLSGELRVTDAVQIAEAA